MKYHYTLLPALAILAIIFFSSCHKNEPIPAYIHIDKCIVNVNPAGFAANSPETGDEGSVSHKISDVWVYIDEQLIGAFEMPVTFPVLSEGVHHLEIRPGIKVNGIAATRAPYPFYQTYSEYIDLKPGTTITLTPTTMYEPFSHFAFMEDFENTGIKLDTTPNTEVPLQKTTIAGQAFEGTASGIAILNNGNTFFECVSSNPYVLPKAGAPIFLEFDYRCDQQFTVGVVALSPYNTEAILNLNPTETWNKAYLYLTPSITPSSSNNFKILMFMSNPDADSVAFLIDNIKIVY